MNCGLCDHDLTIVLDMGEMALAGAFLKPEQFEAERFYPLRFAVCESCGTAQVADPVEPSLLFSDYFYRSSQIATVKRHFMELAKRLVERFSPQSALEIGCNDGALLRALQGRVPVVMGVDPNATEALAVRKYFNIETARDFPDFDLVVACNVFAHVRDLNDMTEAVHRVMKPDGVFVMEAHYLGDLLEGQYDAIYHEHVYYHHLTALETHFARFGLRVFDVDFIPAHGGSMRYYVDRGVRSQSASVFALRAREERQILLGDRIAFKRFAQSAQAHRMQLSDLLNQRRGQQIVGYGASGRANTLIQWCGLELDYIVDDAPARQGTFTPGSHIPVCAPSVMEKAPPDAVFVLAWPYLSDIKAKCDAELIVPFPRPRVMERATA